MEYARIGRENKAIAEKIIAQYLKFDEEENDWAQFVQENEKFLQYVERMKIKYRLDF